MLITIVGGGQLAKMLAEAGAALGYRFSFLLEDQEEDVCVRDLGAVVRFHREQDVAALYHQLGQPDVVTVEKEAVDTDLLHRFKRLCCVHPDPEIIRICQHRGREKRALRSLDIHTAQSREVESLTQLREAVEELGFPVIVKSCEHGYDGLNQWSLNCRQDIERQMSAVIFPEAVVEKRINFDREVSLIAARNSQGDQIHLPPTENVHRDGILLTSIMPALQLTSAHHAQLAEIADKLLSHWSYCGVLAVECFIEGDRVLVNELAPRVHNSGHWTQSGAKTSQFEYHLRAICGLELPEPVSAPAAAMINVLGQKPGAYFKARPDVDVQDYGKSVRPGRKMGHLNIIGASRTQLGKQVQAIVDQLYSGVGSSRRVPGNSKSGTSPRLAQRRRSRAASRLGR